MKINFIGHGLDDKAEKNVGRILCSAFNSPKHFNKFIGLTAFATNSGLSQIISYISDAKASFKKITWYIGVNDQVTTKEALQLLIDNEIETYIFFIEDKLFHPKVYIFEGEVRNKIVIGSSNLTRPGLFVRNIEASVEVDYDNIDAIGKKFRNQINDYFKQLFDNSHESMNLLTSDYLKELVEKKIVRDEIFWLHNNKYEDKGEVVGNLPKRKNRKPDKIGNDLGNLTQNVIRKNSSNNKPKSLSLITDEYLRTWSFYFEELKKFKDANNGNTIIPRNHPDNRLYSWYRKQKHLYNHFDENNIRLIPKEHEVALDSISFFWQDGHILREIRIWETRLKECVEYCKSKKLSYVWVTWEKKDPLFTFKTQASWCIRQRRRISGEDIKPISEYELKRLRDVSFLFGSENEGGKLKEDDFIARLIEISEYKADCMKKGDRNWLPSQTDTDSKIADLGNWLNDKIEWIKTHMKNGTQTNVAKEREKEFLELGIYVEGGIRQSYFEYNAKEYVEMRKRYPIDNPLGEERKPYAYILKWATENKSRFDSFPKWRQKRLLEIGLGK